jgi:hypothetical protein
MNSLMTLILQNMMMDNKNIYKQAIKPVYETVKYKNKPHIRLQNKKYNNRYAIKNNRFRYNNQSRPMIR